jgi:hypothetical protein
VDKARNQAVQLIIEDILICVAKASDWQPPENIWFLMLRNTENVLQDKCVKTVSLVNSLLHVCMYLTPLLFLISSNIIEVFN